jgi:hypothetical protein
MAWTVSADIFITEEGPGRYVVFAWPNLPGPEVVLGDATDIHSAWRASGFASRYFNIKAPAPPLTLDQVRQYLAELRASGLSVQPIEVGGV